jgi:hypothetical protein
MTNDSAVQLQKKTVIYADEFDAEKDIFFDEIYQPSNSKGRRMAMIRSKSNPNAPVRLQFGGSKGGRIPKFGVETNQYGNMVFTFGIPDSKEVEQIKNLEKYLIETAKKNKKIWWNQDISDTSIEDGFRTILTEPVEKPEGDGFWPVLFKSVKVQTNKNGDIENCKIVSQSNESLSIHELPGQKWKTIMVELGCVYFSGKTNWGISKILRLVQASDGIGFSKASDVDFLEIALEGRCLESKSDEEENGAIRKRKNSFEEQDDFGEFNTNKKQKIEESG